MREINRVIVKKVFSRTGLPDDTGKGSNRMHFSAHMQKKKLLIYLTTILNCKFLKNKNYFL